MCIDHVSAYLPKAYYWAGWTAATHECSSRGSCLFVLVFDGSRSFPIKYPPSLTRRSSISRRSSSNTQAPICPTRSRESDQATQQHEDNSTKKPTTAEPSPQQTHNQNSRHTQQLKAKKIVTLLFVLDQYSLVCV